MIILAATSASGNDSGIAFLISVVVCGLFAAFGIALFVIATRYAFGWFKPRRSHRG